MTDRPILFSAPMVRAILAGTKTQTRRVVKLGDRLCRFDADGYNAVTDDTIIKVSWDSHSIAKLIPCPYGQPGDMLWVRETWQAVSGNDRARHIMTHPRPDRGWLEYAATPRDDEPAYKWRPSIHMPRWASRITLEVTGVRVERLQDISEADAMAEGVHYSLLEKIQAGQDRWARHAYKKLWETINGPGSWEANPWVWVVEFKGVAQ